MSTSWKLVTVVVLAMVLVGCGAAMATSSGSHMVGDRVWLDNGGGNASLANNGIQDANEPGINGVSVVLSGGTSTGGIYTYTTKNTVFGTNIAKNGYYLFSGLNDSDTYRITISGVQSGTISGLPGTPVPVPTDPTVPVPAGLVLTSHIVGSDVATIIGQGSDATSYWVDFKITNTYLELDFGFNVPSATYNVGNRVWTDTDGKGDQNATGEPGIDGVTVTLSGTTANGAPLTIVKNTTTAALAGLPAATPAGDVVDGKGCYNFNVPPGTYTISVDAVSALNADGTTSASPLLGLTQTYDRDGIGTKNVATVTVTNADIYNVDFGYNSGDQIKTNLKVGDRVWSDLDKDGKQDAGEPGLNGVTVTLWKPDGTTESMNLSLIHI